MIHNKKEGGGVCGCTAATHRRAIECFIPTYTGQSCLHPNIPQHHPTPFGGGGRRASGCTARQAPHLPPRSALNRLVRSSKLGTSPEPPGSPEWDPGGVGSDSTEGAPGAPPPMDGGIGKSGNAGIAGAGAGAGLAAGWNIGMPWAEGAGAGAAAGG